MLRLWITAIAAVLSALLLSGCNGFGNADWIIINHTISTTAAENGTIEPATASVEYGHSTTFTL
ncbi:MAG TPA: hypothetical protein ENJ24_03925, partial [Gammaproteobacteria bacterium]|nr:hypothetical protein [Gammaproteobacteria bacterium]